MAYQCNSADNQPASPLKIALLLSFAISEKSKFHILDGEIKK